MSLACSSVLRGGGTNQELVLHCLHECGGDVLVSTVRHSNCPVCWIFQAGTISCSVKRLYQHQSFGYEMTGALRTCCLVSLQETLRCLMLRDPLFPRGHHLAAYHYSGADSSQRAASLFFPCLFFCSHILYSLLFLCEKNNPLLNFLPGCDCWTAEEKRYFNKGISAYRKDFFMVQKLVCTLIFSLSGIACQH